MRVSVLTVHLHTVALSKDAPSYVQVAVVLAAANRKRRCN